MVGSDTVAALCRYPVKSMLGESLTHVAVDEGGLEGDRRWAVLDAGTGRIASAKQPRLWRELLTCQASTADGATVHVRLPDRARLPAGDPTLDALLSAALGRTVSLADTAPPGATLERSRPEQVLRDGVTADVEADMVAFGSAAPPGSFFDFAPVHLVTTATLERIAALSPRGSAEIARYRPNIVLDTSAAAFAEHDWAGQDLRIGPDLVLRVIASTPRCAVPTLAHGPLPPDPDALRVPATHNRVPALPGRPPEPCVGVYAQVVQPGGIRIGDRAERHPSIT
nr:MOSC N-terminal beta barrel domain-containing protein [Streptacidiphilus jiangxiensis]